MQVELQSARAEVVRFGIRLDADVAEEPREQRLVQGGVARGVDRRRQRGRPLPAGLLQRGDELAVHVAPLGEPQVRDELRAARVDLPPVRELLRRQVREELPQRDQRQEVGALVAELEVRLVGRLLPLERALARVRHRERTRDDERLGQAAAVARRDHDAADARVERQPRELAPERRQRARVVDGRELGQQLVAVGDRARRRRLHERERGDVGKAERRHAQDDRRERRAQDLRIGEARSCGVVLLGVQAHADAVLDPAAAAGTLVGGGARHLLDREQRRLVADAVALDAGEPGVDHVADAGHCQRRLGHVGREHDPPAGRRREHALLVGHRQPREERQDLDVAPVRPPGESAAQQVAGLADLALARQEHEDVAGARAPEVLHRADDRLLEVLLVVGLLLRIGGADVGAGRGPVADLDRVRAPGHLDDRRGRGGGAEVAREAVRVERGRRDDELEVRPPREELLQVAQQEVDVEAALVRLVDDDRVVAREIAVALRLGEQDAVGHQLHERIGARVVGEADLVADRGAHRLAQLVGDPRGHRARGDAPRLRVADLPPHAAPGREADLGQLRGLAGAGLAADDDDLVRADRALDLAGALRDRQLGREVEARHARGAGGAAGDRLLHVGRQARPFGRRGAPRARRLQPPGEARRVGRGGMRQARGEIGVQVGHREPGRRAGGGRRRGRGEPRREFYRAHPPFQYHSPLAGTRPDHAPAPRTGGLPCATPPRALPPARSSPSRSPPPWACPRSPRTPSRCAGPGAATCRRRTRTRRTRASPTTSTASSTSSSSSATRTWASSRRWPSRGRRSTRRRGASSCGPA